ncbi:MAG: class I SAM-dependent methyltransferase [Bacilli bacterium]|nr:class I SAM-dependent methyltransferase [Bacilli bacterium]
MEYQEFAKYYDMFYENKNYEKEVNFLRSFIEEEHSVLDVGCGTGKHASLLEKAGIKNIDGVNLNKQMLEIARTKMHGNLYQQSVLALSLPKKYTFMISMFAVMNHLKDMEEFKTALLHMKKHLLPKGRMLIDLHNPKSSGEKVDYFQSIKRTMIWNYDKEAKIENSKIVFEIGDKTYEDSHVFRIFSIEEVRQCCAETGIKVIGIFEDYSIDKIGTTESKNLQFLLEKE